MANGLTGIGEQAKAILARLSTKQKGIIGAALVLVLSLMGALLFYSPAESYGTLFSKLSTQGAGEVIEKLKEDKVPYRLEEEGSTIMVPADKVYDLRLSLAQSGIPKGSVSLSPPGFEIFDEHSLVTTSNVEQINYQRALQGELARTISSLKEVESARVHIAMGERSLFQAQDQPPSASVALQLKSGQKLTEDEIRGIVHLVSSSINGLTPERVTLLDSRGKLLSADLEDDPGIEEQRELETTLEKGIEDMLVNMVGYGKVAVKVTAEIDYNQVDRTENIYDKDKTAIRSESMVLNANPNQGTIGGLAGAPGNLPGAPAPVATPAPNATGDKSQETRNYEISNTITRIIGPKAQLKRLHVAVLLDDNAAPKAATSQSTSQSTSQPVAPGWTKERLAAIELLARQAAGLNAARGDEIEVHSFPFVATPSINFEDKEPAGLQSWLPLAGAGLLGLFALAFLATRKKKEPAKPVTTIQVLPAKLTALEEALPALEQSKTLALETTVGPALPTIREQALELAKLDAVKASRVLSLWLASAGNEKQEQEQKR